MFTGQASAAGVKGFKGGYNFIDQAESASQEAKLREERIKKAVTENKLLDIAYSDVAGESEADKEVQALKQRVDEQDKQIKSTHSTTVRKDLNDAVLPTNGKDRSKMIETLKSRFKTNPDIYKSLGLQNPQTMSILNPRDQRDRKWMMDTLAQSKVTPESQGLKADSPEWQKILDDAIDGYPAMKADGSIVDLAGLSVAMGASTMANPEHNDRMTKNWQELRGRLTRSANNAEAALSTEPMEPMPKPETVEQNQMVNPTTGAEIGMQGEGQDNTQVEPVADSIIDGQATRETQKVEGRAKVKDMIAIIESGGDPTTGKNEYGYEGKYQFRYDSPKDAGYDIAKKLGYTADEIRQDPKKQEEVMDVYLDQNATSLENKGHEATPYNLWLAHNQGAGGANAIITGKLTPQIRKNIEAQGVSGNTDKELIANYHAKFAPKMDGEASAVSTQVSSTIDNEINKQGEGKPLSDMRMRKVYALLGKSYPKDPNESTAKMKNYEFLKGTVGEDKAFEAVFGTKDTTKLSRLGKTIRDANDAYARGDKKAGDILMKGADKMADKRTSTQYGYDEAREANKALIARGRDTWTDEDKDDFASNEEIIQSFEKPSNIESIEEKLKMQKEAHEVSNKYASDINKAITSGTTLSPEAEGDLKYSQQLARQSAPSKTVESDGKLVEKMQANQLGANEIATTLNRLESGDLASVEKGVIDNALQYVETKLPKGFTLGKDRQATIDANIKAGSALGFLQATLIKAMSGTAASDAEVQRLTDVMQGNNWNQPEALKKSLKEFYDVLDRQQGTFRTQLRVSPYEAYSLSILQKVGGEADRTGMPTRTIGNETRYWDGKAWVK